MAVRELGEIRENWHCFEWAHQDKADEHVDRPNRQI